MGVLRKRRLTSKRYIFFFLTVTAATLSVIFFYTSRTRIFGTLLSDDANLHLRKSFSQLVEASSGVKMKKIDQHVWKAAIRGAKFFHFDSVMTPSGGRAVVKYDNGVELVLGENTLIVLKEAPKGSIAPVVNIFSGDILVIGGEVIVHSRNETFKLGPKTVFKSSYMGSKNELTKFEMLPPKHIYPKVNSIVKYSEDKRSIKFKWTKRPGSEKYNIAIAKDIKFKDLVFSGNSQTNSLDVTKLDREGKYYWRVEAISERFGNSGQGPSSPFVLVKLPEHLKPMNKEVVRAQKVKQGLVVKWEKLPNVSNYKVQISKRSDFKTALFNKSISRSAFKFNKKLPMGVYYWRVLYKNENLSRTVKSFPTTFEVISKPKHIRPKNKTAVRKKDHIIFKWSGPSSGVFYKLIVAKDKFFKKIIVKEIHKTNSAKVRKIKTPGVYYWKVTLDHPKFEFDEVSYPTFFKLKR